MVVIQDVFLGYFSLPKRLILWDRATTSYPKLVIRKRIPKMMYYFCSPGICVMFASCNFALCNIYHVNLAGNQWSTFLSLLMVLLWRMYQPSLRKSSHLPWQWHPMETVSSVLVTSHLYVMCLIALFSNWGSPWCAVLNVPAYETVRGKFSSKWVGLWTS